MDETVQTKWVIWKEKMPRTKGNSTYWEKAEEKIPQKKPVNKSQQNRFMVKKNVWRESV